jgi:predicted enzyme related to lactoylglutathione lyase
VAGKLTHFEIPADDTARAREFYASLFGWQYATWDGPNEYHMVQAEPSGAVYPRQGDEPGPRIWFDTDDLDAHIARVRELGGEASDRAPIPGVGWFTICKDTEGNEFGIVETDESAGGPAGGA